VCRFAAGIERRNSDQAVDAALRLEIAEGILAGGGKGDAFDARFVAGLKIDDVGFEPLRLHPSRYMRNSISAQSWASVPPAPALMETMALLASSSPSSIMSRENWCIRRPRSLIWPDGFRQRIGIRLFYRQLQQDTRFLQVFFQTVKGIDPLAQKVRSFKMAVVASGIVPESIPGNFRFDFLEPFFLADQVKDTP
jgi:hypothetical protein